MFSYIGKLAKCKKIVIIIFINSFLIVQSDSKIKNSFSVWLECRYPWLGYTNNRINILSNESIINIRDYVKQLKLTKYIINDTDCDEIT